jgi:hypothetical protein
MDPDAPVIVEPGVRDIVVVELLMPHGLATIGGVNIGLTPALLSSVAPSGMPPPGRAPAVAPPRIEVDAVPDAVPADVPGPHDPDKPIGPELKPNEASPWVVPGLMPEPSNVDVEPVVALDTPALKHGSVLAVGSSGPGLSPPGASSVAPIGIPTGPTEDVAPSTPRGDVAPIAGAPTIGGAICAKAAPQPRSSAANVVKKCRNDTSRSRNMSPYSQSSAKECNVRVSCWFSRSTRRPPLQACRAPTSHAANSRARCR